MIRILGFEIPEHYYELALAGVFWIGWVVIGLIAKRALFRKLKKWADTTTTRLDDLLIGSLNLPLALLVISSGALIAARIAPFTFAPGNLYTIMLGSTVIAFILFIDRLLNSAIQVYSDRVGLFKSAGGLIQAGVRGLVVIIGVMVLLGTLGVQITPLLASLGVGSLAVALALQPTLENFFAGVQTVADQQIMEGHLIKLETGEEGIVEKITLRSTWLRTMAGNMVIFPNKLLVTTRIQNFYYPDKQVSFSVPVSVHYSSDLEKVERVTVDVAKGIQQTAPGAVKEHVPSVRFSGFGPNGIDFTVGLRIEDYLQMGLVRHEFVKKLMERFRQEEITIPFPAASQGSRPPQSGVAS